MSSALHPRTDIWFGTPKTLRGSMFERIRNHAIGAALLAAGHDFIAAAVAVTGALVLPKYISSQMA
jgi:hypothetical protein